MTHLHWFREDLRLEDNPAFQHQLPDAALYIYDESLIGDAQKIWLHFSLQALEKSLKKHLIPLIIAQGEPHEVWSKLLKKYQLQKVTWNQSYNPAVFSHDEKVKHLIEEKSIQVETFSGSLLLSPEILLTQSGGFYKVFTPFWEAHQKIYEIPQKPSRLKSPQHPANIPSSSLENLGLLKNPVISIEQFQKEWCPGEEGALSQLQSFIRHSLKTYAHDRDIPALGKTSRLSPHLHFGEISPQTIAREIHKLPSQPYLRELVFRDFANYLLFHCPDLPHTPFKKEFSKWKWSDDIAHFNAWKKGKTGYPLIDAGMRELYETGFMHNRVRMVVASFLIKDLNISWQKGAAWFLERLLDADVANNSFNWQWSAGTGLDAQPYFRIFNPELQSEKFDSEGIYIRKWVPELTKLPDKYIHAPWKAPEEILRKAGIRLGKDYPSPIVDHNQAKKWALEQFQKIKKLSSH